MRIDNATFLGQQANADAGDADAQYQTGLCYAQGNGVAQDYQQAARYWLLAAKQQHADAQVGLGTLFEKGLAVPHDPVRAAQCYQVAAEQGSATAKVRLAILYMQGKGVAHDPKKAIGLFIQAANQGDATAEYNLGVAYDKGLGGLTQNADQAFFWYQQASLQQHPQARQKIQEPRFAERLASMGIAETTDNSITSSTVSDSQIPKGNASEGSDTSDGSGIALVDSHQADTIFEQGAACLPNDIVTAMHCFRQAAEQGHVKSQYNLGLAYLYGIGGIPLDGEKAIDWLQQAADQGFRPAYFVLGWLYQGGQVADKSHHTTDATMAIGYYEVAAELGHAQAQYFLSKIYETGNGVMPDSDMALAWLRQSAKQGYNQAYYELERRLP